jgi:hypothetical protein
MVQQIPPSWQAFPQLPQFMGSEERFVQVVPPQQVSPAGQAVTPPQRLSPGTSVGQPASAG